MSKISKDLVGRRIVAYGQVTTVTGVENNLVTYIHNEVVKKPAVIHIEPSIVVPGKEYTRDYLHEHEITEIEPEPAEFWDGDASHNE